MSELFIESTYNDEDISLNTDKWESMLAELASNHTFFFKEDDTAPMLVGDLVSSCIEPLLKSVILNMRTTLDVCQNSLDEDYSRALGSVKDDYTLGIQNESIKLNYSEAVFIEEYTQEVSDWIPLTFEMTIIPNKNNISSVVQC